MCNLKGYSQSCVFIDDYSEDGRLLATRPRFKVLGLYKGMEFYSKNLASQFWVSNDDQGRVRGSWQ